MLLAVLAGLFAPGARAQDENAQAAGTASGEVTITCPWFGVGGVVRPGDWAGLRLAINDSGGKQREVLVRISMLDPDGDTILYERTLTTNPGVNQPLWMYIQLPYSFQQTSVLNISAYAAIEQESGSVDADGSRWIYGAGRLLGTATIGPRATLNKTDGLIGVAGPRIMGLGRYTGVPGQTYLPGGHERAEVLTRLDADLLPDRWHGLMPMSVLVWNEPPPGNIDSERAQAIREWVQRGGHLIVVLPRVAQTWTNEASNPLFDIVPKVRVQRRDKVDLTPYRRLITSPPPPGELLIMPAEEVLQTFTPLEDALPEEAICILAGEPTDRGDREWLVVRRLVGAGRVDLVGLDVASRWMDARGLPDPERFWNRILGRRAELFSPQEALVASQGIRGRDFSRSGPITVDKDLGELTSQNSSAAVGVLLGFVVFITYWLVAGPLGYAVLRRTGRARHGWVAFAAAAGVFTAIAWGGARVIRPAEVRAQHVTLLDHVYGQPTQRARSWLSLMVPQYGEATLSVTDPSLRTPAGIHNLVVPWAPEGGASSGFPDASGYRLDSKAPDRVTFPTRSTVKQFQIDWAGGPRWGMPRPIGSEGEAEPKITVGRDGRRDVIRGVLAHSMPAPLTDAVIIVNLGLKPVNDTLHSRTLVFPMLADVRAFKLPAPWAPGEPFDLSILDLNARAKDPIDGDAFMKALTNDLGPIDNDQTLGAKGSPVTRLLAMSLFHQLEPPDTRGNMQRPSHWVQRQATHGWDLSAWFAQPCVIIIGRLSGPGVAPVPPWVSTGGAAHEVTNDGMTIVRWVYPLPARPPAIAPDPGGEEDLLSPGEDPQ